jgi:hypothetical protein
MMRPALLSNPAWQAQSVLRIHGGDLLENVHSDVSILINPETELEFRLPEKAAAVTHTVVADEARELVLTR